MAELENKIENTKTETVDNTGAKQEEEKVTLTQKELDDLIQRKSDARVTQALKTQEKKNAEKLKEAEKLAKMSADEKYAYELEQREKLIEQRELELALAENKNACAKILADKGLSLALVDFCVDTNADVMSDNIKKLDSAFKASVKAAEYDFDNIWIDNTNKLKVVPFPNVIIEKLMKFRKEKVDYTTDNRENQLHQTGKCDFGRPAEDLGRNRSHSFVLQRMTHSLALKYSHWFRSLQRTIIFCLLSTKLITSVPMHCPVLCQNNSNTELHYPQQLNGIWTRLERIGFSDSSATKS